MSQKIDMQKARDMVEHYFDLKADEIEDTGDSCVYRRRMSDMLPAALDRIAELKSSLGEYRRLGKIIGEFLPCLTVHGDCNRCDGRTKVRCDAIRAIAEGKIDNIDLSPNQRTNIVQDSGAQIGGELAIECLMGEGWDDSADAIRRLSATTRQITEERKIALKQVIFTLLTGGQPEEDLHWDARAIVIFKDMLAEAEARP